MTFEEKTKKISCALYITSKVAKNPILRAHNLKYLKSLGVIGWFWFRIRILRQKLLRKRPIVFQKPNLADLCYWLIIFSTSWCEILSKFFSYTNCKIQPGDNFGSEFKSSGSELFWASPEFFQNQSGKLFESWWIEIIWKSSDLVLDVK